MNFDPYSKISEKVDIIFQLWNKLQGVFNSTWTKVKLRKLDRFILHYFFYTFCLFTNNCLLPAMWEAETRGLLEPRSSGPRGTARWGVCTKFRVSMVTFQERRTTRRGEPAQVRNGAGQNSHADQNLLTYKY